MTSIRSGKHEYNVAKNAYKVFQNAYRKKIDIVNYIGNSYFVYRKYIGKSRGNTHVNLNIDIHINRALSRQNPDS